MRENTKITFAFIGGAALGSLICFALLKDRYKQLADEEIEAMKDYYEKELEQMEDAYDKELDELVETLDVKTLKTEGSMKKMYHKYAKPYVSDDADQLEYDHLPGEDYEEDSPPEDPPENDLMYEEPFVISREEFDNEYSHYDKITITYYEVDDVLADEQEEVISDINAVVGYESLSRFGDMSDDDNIVYVRNGRLGADYEVILSQDSYTESVLGIVDEVNRNGRRKV